MVLQHSIYLSFRSFFLSVEAGGVHIIQAFFSEDQSEEVQIQGRTSRQGKSGTYSLILAESEVRDLGLDPGKLKNMQTQACYKMLCQAREGKRAVLVKEMEERLGKTNDFDAQSHLYFDALIDGNCSLARDRLKDLHKKRDKLGCAGPTAAYHFVCCYDESSSMRKRNKWQSLVRAHFAFMQKLQHDPSTKVSIVQFGRSARAVLECGDVAKALQTNLVCQGGGTSFEPSLREVLRLMRAGVQRWSSLAPVLLFMSDGDNQDGDCIQTITNMQREFPTMVFHAVIFGASDSPKLRRMVGAASNGQFHVSINGVELVETFTTIASSLEYTGQKWGFRPGNECCWWGRASQAQDANQQWHAAVQWPLEIFEPSQLWWYSKLGPDKQKYHPPVKSTRNPMYNFDACLFSNGDGNSPRHARNQSGIEEKGRVWHFLLASINAKPVRRLLHWSHCVLVFPPHFSWLSHWPCSGLHFVKGNSNHQFHSIVNFVKCTN